MERSPYCMIMRRSFSLDNLSREEPPLDDDQKTHLLRAPFTESSLFGGKLAATYQVKGERRLSTTL